MAKYTYNDIVTLKDILVGKSANSQQMKMFLCNKDLALK